jgi:tetratricopeptide (TPR) repeat protein
MPPARTKKTTGKNKQRRAAEVEPSVSPPDRRLWKVCACLAVAVVALYWRVLGNMFVNFDDGDYVYDNSHVKSGLSLDNVQWALTNISHGNWHPLTWLSHMLDAQWFGPNPAGHHLVSVLWHAANAVALLVVLWRMTGRLWRSAFVAALFALHPLRVESVAWVAERKDVLSAFFYLCTLGTYAWYTRKTQSWRRYAAVAAMLSLALMSKPSAVTAPFLLLLLDYWPLARKERLAVLLREKIPLFALAAADSVVTYVSQQQAGAMTAVEVAFPDRLANVVVAYVRYLGKILWPHPLAVMYPYPRALPAATVLACCLLLAVITALALRFRSKAPYLPVGWFWFLGVMVPMSGVVQVGWQSYADRYTYIPSIGIFIALVWMAADVIETRKWRLAAPIAALAILPPLAAATWLQEPYWYDGITLFQHAVAATSDNPAAAYHLGVDLSDLGRNAEAIPLIEEMIRLQPGFYTAYYVLGRTQAAQGDVQSAIRNFTEALRRNPDYADALYGRGTLYVRMGNDPAADPDLRAALKSGLSAEQQAVAHNYLGVILGRRGDARPAAEEFQQAVRLQPAMVDAQRNLATALAAQGRVPEAIAQLERALSATHGDPGIRTMLDTLKAQR